MAADTPNFPEELSTIDLPKLSLSRLTSCENSESAQLLDAARRFGCFFLDLSGCSSGQRLLGVVDDAWRIGEDFCALPLAEKSEFGLDSSNCGYKPSGVLKFQDGRPDLTEIFSLSEDVLFNGAADSLPAVYAKPTQRSIVKAFAKDARLIAMLIIERLAAELHVPPSTFQSLHDQSKPSTTIIRVNHNLPQPAATTRQPSLPGHTDTSSITVLFTKMGGLQILPKGAQDYQKAWLWVKPEPACAIINIGEAMVQWTAGLLHSSFHRVLHAPGAQAERDRYSLGYFLKPVNDAPMHCLRHGSITPHQNIDDLGDANFARYDTWHKVRVKRVYHEQR